MKKVLIYILRGVLVAALGIVFAALFASVFNGVEPGSACAVGMGVYLCIVVVACTGVVVSKIEKLKGETASEKEDK